LAILILSVSVTISTVSVCFKPRYVCKIVHELLYPLMGSLPSKSLSALPLYNYFMHCLKRRPASVECPQAFRSRFRLQKH
jgi:hypothetical protein